MFGQIKSLINNYNDKRLSNKNLSGQTRGHSSKPSSHPERRPISASKAIEKKGASDKVHQKIKSNHSQSNEESIEKYKKDVQDVLKFSGRVLTASGESMDLPPRQKRVVAILENGTMVADKANRLDPNVLSTQEAAERQGIRIRKTLYVDLNVIRKIYEKAAQRSTLGGSYKDVTRMEKDFIDLVSESARAKASDIYIQVDRFEASVFLRVNGVIRALRQMPSDYSHEMLAAAFSMSNESDASYKRHDIQSARISDDKTPLPNGVQSLRLQYQPLSGDGRLLVARLLYHQEHTEGSDVHSLGYSKAQVEQIKEMRRKPYGINIISGPTGSGKSTTLQLSLSAQMEERNHQIRIMTIEDPPEYNILGASQVPILNVHTDDERRGAFTRAISSALRSAPDIIMVGEVRDEASSRLSFEAAMTGHQVWTTVHSNTAHSIMDRFRDWHVEEFKLTDENLVTGLVGQRLVRVLCNSCKIPFSEASNKTTSRGKALIEQDALSHYIAVFGEDTVQNFFYCNENGCGAQGCDLGYTGRSVIAECINPDGEFMDMIRQGKKREAHRYWMDNLGGILMIEHAASKVLAGIFDPRDAETKIGSFRDIETNRVNLIKQLASELM